MSDLEAIQSVLLRAARRQRWERAWNGLWQGLLLGASVWLAVLVIYKLAPISPLAPNAAAIFAGLCVLAGFARGWMRNPTLQQTARSLDARQNLKERLSTALELAPTGPVEGWRALLISDAARFAAKEATIKVLRPVGHQPDWRSVEVRRDAGGWWAKARVQMP